MEQGDRRRAKLRVVDGMRHGLPCKAALKLADVPISERTAYRALKIVRAIGEEGLAEGRHGHPYKLTVPIREWLVEYCRSAPGTPSRTVQAEIREKFGGAVSISQINRTRKALGISSQEVGKKSAEQRWRVGRGRRVSAAPGRRPRDRADRCAGSGAA